MYNLKKICQFNMSSVRVIDKMEKIPRRASILIILTYPKHMKYYIHFVAG